MLEGDPGEIDIIGKYLKEEDLTKIFNYCKTVYETTETPNVYVWVEEEFSFNDGNFEVHYSQTEPMWMTCCIIPLKKIYRDNRLNELLR